MLEIDNAAIETVYSSAKKIYHEGFEKKNELEFLAEVMNKTSATNYIDVFHKMMIGQAYKRTINIEATQYFLENILKDFGQDAAIKAIDATLKHIEYYRDVTNSSKNGKSSKIELVEKFINEHEIDLNAKFENILPEVDSELNYPEGSLTNRKVNAYERNKKARNKCIEIYGAKCCVCGFKFSDTYGDIGIGYIEIHHVVELNMIGKEYNVDPKTDLKPVCPNCHAMLHTRKPALSISELVEIIKSKK